MLILKIDEKIGITNLIYGKNYINKFKEEFMVNNKLKNIIVLKGMASNVVQEAIVILKPNVDLEKSSNIIKNKDHNIENNKKKSVVLEAEYVIKNYIKEIENTNTKRKNKKIEKKYKYSKILNIILLIGFIISLV